VRNGFANQGMAPALWCMLWMMVIPSQQQQKAKEGRTKVRPYKGNCDRARGNSKSVTEG
jgi:hypothetical protein